MAFEKLLANTLSQLTGQPFRLEKGQYGTRLIPIGKWSQSHSDLLKRNDVVELELNHAKGFRSELKAPSFLTDKANLLGLYISFPFGDLAPLNDLRKLRALTVMHCRAARGLNLDRFASLEEVALEWFRGAEGIFSLENIRDLALFFYPGKGSSDPFINFTKLEELRLSATGLQEIESFSMMKKLHRLELLAMNHLRSLKGIETLHGLRKLRIETCKKLSSIEPISGLTDLQYLSISNCGDIASFEPIRKLRDLEILHFFESTNIVDGNLSVLKQLPKVKDIRFKKRRHYQY